MNANRPMEKYEHLTYNFFHCKCVRKYFINNDENNWISV
jgi:hypothetical protein